MSSLKGLKHQRWLEWKYIITLAYKTWPKTDLDEWGRSSKAMVETEEDANELDSEGISKSAEDDWESEYEGDSDADPVPVPDPGPEPEPESKPKPFPDPDPEPEPEHQEEESDEGSEVEEESDCCYEDGDEGDNEEASATSEQSSSSSDREWPQQQSSQTERTPRVSRPSFTPRQVEELENIFKFNQYPCIIMRNDLASRMSVTEERVRIWFKNCRSKFRRLRSMPSCSSNSMNQTRPVTFNLGRKRGTSFVQKPGCTWVMRNNVPVAQVPMPPPMVPVLPVLPPAAAAPPGYPSAPLAYPPPAPPVYPPAVCPPPHCPPPLYPSPLYPPPPLCPPPLYPLAHPIYSATAPAMQPQFTNVMLNLPVYPQLVPPCCPPSTSATWVVTIRGPYCHPV